MPILKNAIKKMRQDAKKTQLNLADKTRLKTALAKAKKSGDTTTLSNAFSLLDKASKNGLIHKNKAARHKASLAKYLKVEPVKEVLKTKKKITKKTA